MNKSEFNDWDFKGYMVLQFHNMGSNIIQGIITQMIFLYVLLCRSLGIKTSKMVLRPVTYTYYYAGN